MGTISRSVKLLLIANFLASPSCESVFSQGHLNVNFMFVNRNCYSLSCRCQINVLRKLDQYFNIQGHFNVNFIIGKRKHFRFQITEEQKILTDLSHCKEYNWQRKSFQKNILNNQTKFSSVKSEYLVVALTLIFKIISRIFLLF